MLDREQITQPCVQRHVTKRNPGRVTFPAMREAGFDADELGQRLRTARAEAPSRSSGEVG